MTQDHINLCFSWITPYYAFDSNAVQMEIIVVILHAAHDGFVLF